MGSSSSRWFIVNYYYLLVVLSIPFNNNNNNTSSSIIKKVDSKTPPSPQPPPPPWRTPFQLFRLYEETKNLLDTDDPSSSSTTTTSSSSSIHLSNESNNTKNVVSRRGGSTTTTSTTNVDLLVDESHNNNNNNNCLEDYEVIDLDVTDDDSTIMEDIIVDSSSSDSSSSENVIIPENSASKQTSANETSSRNNNNINLHELTIVVKDEIKQEEEEEEEAIEVLQTTPYMSSGIWQTIDSCTSSSMSRKLYGVRKTASKYTGLTGFLSGKPKNTKFSPQLSEEEIVTQREQLQKRLAAIELARTTADRASEMEEERSKRGIKKRPANNSAPRGGLFQKIRIRRQMNRQKRMEEQNQNSKVIEKNALLAHESNVASSSSRETIQHPAARNAGLTSTEEANNDRFLDKLKEIEDQILLSRERLLDLQLQRDQILQSPNPFYNYTRSSESYGPSTISRKFDFPPTNLVNEYIDELVYQRRLVMMNHTYLWTSKDYVDEIDELDDEIGSDILTPSANVRKLYESPPSSSRRRRRSRDSNSNSNGSSGNGGGGSWVLRQKVGGETIGEKVGYTIEISAYKAVCASIMSILAKSIALLHSQNIMGHSDINLFLNYAADLPPAGDFPGSDTNYAEEAIKKAIRRGAKRRKRARRRNSTANGYGDGDGEYPFNHSDYYFGDDDNNFMQRDAIAEMLLAHCQISAPLLKLFPILWQRALLGNIISLVTSVISDFAAGIKVQILGHQLSLCFKPITEDDFLRDIERRGHFRRISKVKEFESAVRATADDISSELEFMDKWHEKLLGGEVLKAQIGNLIARVVLTLLDEIFSSLKIDLWSSQAGGPLVVASLNYRDETKKMEENLSFEDVFYE